MDLRTHVEHIRWDRRFQSTWTPYHENGQKFNVFVTGFNTMPVMLDEIRKRHGNFELLVDEAGNRLTYKQVFETADVLARSLALTEFSRLELGDKVAICSRNSFDWVICYAAAIYAGMIVIPMNSWWTPREIEYAVKHSDCKLIFADHERIERIQKIENFKAKVVLISDDIPIKGSVGVLPLATLKEYIDFGHVLDTGNVSRPSVVPDQPAMMMYTSGTTSFPKGVVLTHRGICHTCNVNDKISNRGVPVSGSGVVLLTVPLFHATGLYAVMFTSMLAGRKIVMMRKWNAEKALELVERERVTHFTGVPTMVLEMLASPERQKRNISSLKNISSGGAPPPAGVAKSVKEKLGAAPAQGYGLTETNAIATMIGAKDYLQRPTSCGRPAPGVEIRIWSETEDDVVLPVGETGRIVIRGPGLMLEYWKDPEATTKAITKDGWFKCGDYGNFDKDGFLYISGRSQDLIIRGGENISARHVEEAVFANFDGIQECAVFGYPHPTLGEEVGIAVHMKQGVKPPTLEEIRSKCSGQISQFMLPTGITVFTSTLPRGATGKTVKKDIKEMLKQGKLANWTTWTSSSSPKSKM